MRGRQQYGEHRRVTAPPTISMVKLVQQIMYADQPVMEYSLKFANESVVQMLSADLHTAFRQPRKTAIRAISPLHEDQNDARKDHYIEPWWMVHDHNHAQPSGRRAIHVGKHLQSPRYVKNRERALMKEMNIGISGESRQLL